MEGKLLSNEGFDLWADEYDEFVDICDNNESYPFAGYKIILNEIYNRILNASYKNILDISFGFRVIIVIEANSYVNISSSRLLPKSKTEKTESLRVA